MKLFKFLTMLVVPFAVANNLRNASSTERGWFDIDDDDFDSCSLYLFKSICRRHKDCYWDKKEYSCHSVWEDICFDRKTLQECKEDSHCFWNKNDKLCKWKHRCSQYKNNDDCIDDEQCDWVDSKCQYAQ